MSLVVEQIAINLVSTTEYSTTGLCYLNVLFNSGCILSVVTQHFKASTIDPIELKFHDKYCLLQYA